MLSPVLFSNLSELKSKIEKNAGANALGICPGPALADKYRDYLHSIGCHGLDVVTVFQFAQNMLTLDPAFDRGQLCNKSKLILSLTTLWKAKFPELGLSDFQLAYKVFTDLRGHFLVPDFLDSVLTDLRPDVKKCIIYFWHFLNQAKLFDEHGVYGELSHQLRTPAHPAYEYLPNQTYLFFGFRHFTGVQVDFLKALAIKNDVYVFIPQLAYIHSRATDWITWLFPKGESETVEKQSEENVPTSVNCKVLRPATNRYSEFLIKLLVGDKATNVILAKSELSISDLTSIYQDNYFKLESKFFSYILQNLKKEFLLIIEAEKDSSATVVSLNSYIDRRCKNILIQNDLKNQRILKVLLLIRDNLKLWEELSEHNSKVGVDAWKMICESTELNIPRNFLIPITFSRHHAAVISAKGLELGHADGGSIMVVSEQFGDIVSETSVFTNSVLESVAPLSPLRSADLEKYFFKFWFNLFLQQENNILLLEHGIEDRSFFWKIMLDSLEIPGEQKLDLLHKKTAKDILQPYITQKYGSKEFSPSRLQNYIDCPRKFYFQEVEKCRLDKTTKVQLESFELGEIEHLIIRDYFEKKLMFDDEVLVPLIDLRLMEYLENRKTKMLASSLRPIKKEILEYSINGIKILKSLIEKFNFRSMNFEIPISEGVGDCRFKGRIDCILENDSSFAIFDFKRGAGSIPSLQAFNDFEKLQVWFYLSHYSSNKIPISFGLICLGKPDKSLVQNIMDFESDNDLLDENMQVKLRKISRLDYQTRIKEYKLFEQELVQRIQVDHLFSARPLKINICDFCDLRALCSKGHC